MADHTKVRCSYLAVIYPLIIDLIDVYSQAVGNAYRCGSIDPDEVDPNGFRWYHPCLGEFFDLEKLSKTCADTGRYTFYFSL